MGPRVSPHRRPNNSKVKHEVFCVCFPCCQQRNKKVKLFSLNSGGKLTSSLWMCLIATYRSVRSTAVSTEMGGSVQEDTRIYIFNGKLSLLL